MTVNKKQWEALAKKYPDKASWVRALSDLSWGEHDELFSALVELSPQDVSGKAESVGVTNITPVFEGIDAVAIGREIAKSMKLSEPIKIDKLDASKISPTEEAIKQASEAGDKVREGLEKADKALMKADKAQAKAESAHNAALDAFNMGSDLETKLYSLDPVLSEKDIVKIVNRELGRGLDLRVDLSKKSARPLGGDNNVQRYL